MLEFYQTHLKSQLSATESIFLCILLNILQSVKKIRLEVLASVLPIPITFESRRKKLQRFLSLPSLTVEQIWFPIITEWLTSHIQSGRRVYVAIDRTTWCCINLLMLAVIWDKRAIPVYFGLLPSLGNSDLAEQTSAIEKIMPIFSNYKLCILGDREFCSVKLATWLSERKVSFCLRLRKNCFVEREPEIFIELKNLGLRPGISIFLEGVKVTKTKKVKSFNLACKWKRKALGFAPKEGWFILTDLSLSDAVVSYKKRFDIEEMFRDFKRGGYDLEGTMVSGERFLSLVLLIAMAYTAASMQGQSIKRTGVQKYVGRVKENGRVERRHSSFYVGLYGQTWVSISGNCERLVEELLRLAPNKHQCYQRGKRAMVLLQSRL